MSDLRTAPADAPEGAPAPEPRRAGAARRRAGRPVRWAAFGWLGCLAVEWLVDGRYWFGELAGAVPPFTFVVLPLLLAALVPLTRGADRWRTGGAVVLTLVLGAGQSGINFGALWSRDHEAGRDAIRVVAWNTNSWNQLLGTQDHFYAFLKAKQADVYLLHEYQHLTPDRKGREPVDDLARLRAEFPGYEIITDGELVTLSRFPVVARPAVGPARAVAPDADWNTRYRQDKVLRTDLLVKGRTVSFYNLHMPVWNSMTDGPLSGAFYSHMRENFGARQDQYAGLEQDVADNPNPVVVAGDFNTTAAMSELDGLRSRLDDAMGASDDLYPTSWEEGGWKPFWRTDWAFTGQGATADTYRFDSPEKLSDHAVQDLWVSVAQAPAGKG
ncbi:endonuclease/exonuclease/phosphatase family protein [Streptomyces sp. NBC_00083]|uniref:endonuclease/exonuclease/phosphatase family protein n=1 Tax=Streptomyces sp. NBC_00083 TaxID=2975647 RepID=UPI00225625ED|nr:endonuclease/exonuclease/phosphatase family protein [Streptomyces sp. NBC_00083]MCX5385567.1 endonuclease/exonuclease/phosphatase family protein [Streptomyces sp. NBC_00083]